MHHAILFEHTQSKFDEMEKRNGTHKHVRIVLC